jgi:hypothetical protein
MGLDGERQRINTEFLWGNLLDDVHLEDWEEDGGITLKWILGK